MMAIMMLNKAGHRGDAERCRALGITSYLFKPIRKAELFLVILTVLGLTVLTPQPTTTTLSKPLQGKLLNILLAEDNRVNPVVATRMLEKMGHVITEQTMRPEALVLLAAHSFDLVLTYIQMQPGTAPPPTGLAGDDHALSFADHCHHGPCPERRPGALPGAGMDGSVLKPIRAVLENWQSLRRWVHPAPTLHETAENPLGIHTGELGLLRFQFLARAALGRRKAPS